MPIPFVPVLMLAGTYLASSRAVKLGVSFLSMAVPLTLWRNNRKLKNDRDEGFDSRYDLNESIICEDIPNEEIPFWAKDLPNRVVITEIELSELAQIVEANPQLEEEKELLRRRIRKIARFSEARMKSKRFKPFVEKKWPELR